MTCSNSLVYFLLLHLYENNFGFCLKLLGSCLLLVAEREREYFNFMFSPCIFKVNHFYLPTNVCLVRRVVNYCSQLDAPDTHTTGPNFTLPNADLLYLLTPWSRVLLEKLTGSSASQEIPRIFRTRRFITVLTSARHLSLS